MFTGKGLKEPEAVPSARRINAHRVGGQEYGAIAKNGHCQISDSADRPGSVRRACGCPIGAGGALDWFGGDAVVVRHSSLTSRDLNGGCPGPRTLRMRTSSSDTVKARKKGRNEY